MLKTGRGPAARQASRGPAARRSPRVRSRRRAVSCLIHGRAFAFRPFRYFRPFYRFCLSNVRAAPLQAKWTAAASTWKNMRVHFFGWSEWPSCVARQWHCCFCDTLLLRGSPFSGEGGLKGTDLHAIWVMTESRERGSAPDCPWRHTDVQTDTQTDSHAWRHTGRHTYRGRQTGQTDTGPFPQGQRPAGRAEGLFGSQIPWAFPPVRSSCPGRGVAWPGQVRRRSLVW